MSREQDPQPSATPPAAPTLLEEAAGSQAGRARARIIITVPASKNMREEKTTRGPRPGEGAPLKLKPFPSGIKLPL